MSGVIRATNLAGHITLWATRWEGRIYAYERGLNRRQAKLFAKWWEQSYAREVMLKRPIPDIEHDTAVELALYHFKNQGA